MYDNDNEKPTLYGLLPDKERQTFCESYCY